MARAPAASALTDVTLGSLLSATALDAARRPRQRWQCPAPHRARARGERAGDRDGRVRLGRPGHHRPARAARRAGARDRQHRRAALYAAWPSRRAGAATARWRARCRRPGSARFRWAATSAGTWPTCRAPVSTTRRSRRARRMDGDDRAGRPRRARSRAGWTREAGRCSCTATSTGSRRSTTPAATPAARWCGVRSSSEAIVCACHGSTFRLADGELLRGPATSSQPAFDVRVRRGGRSRSGRPSREHSPRLGDPSRFGGADTIRHETAAPKEPRRSGRSRNVSRLRPPAHQPRALPGGDRGEGLRPRGARRDPRTSTSPGRPVWRSTLVRRVARRRLPRRGRRASGSTRWVASWPGWSGSG